jgi:hypothetical protein
MENAEFQDEIINHYLVYRCLDPRRMRASQPACD